MYTRTVYLYVKQYTSNHVSQKPEFQTRMYRKRRELIPPNPKTMIDLDVHLPMFQYNRDETIVKGDQVLSDGRRVVVFTSNAHLKLLSKTEEVLADGTFRTTPRPWKQSFIISAKVTSSVFVPVVFVLLPDKKRGDGQLITTNNFC